MRDDHESRNKDDCPYLVGNLNEQWHQTLSPQDLCQLYKELLRFHIPQYITRNYGHLLQSEQCCSPDHWSWGIGYVWRV